MGLPDLIPQVPRPLVLIVSKLFGNPEKSSPTISPDGKRFAYLANSDKGVRFLSRYALLVVLSVQIVDGSGRQVLNIFVQTVGAEDAKQVTNDTHRGIRFYEWANNNRHILFKQARIASSLSAQHHPGDGTA
eukprot:1452804-Rhodomonas_salina.1